MSQVEKSDARIGEGESPSAWIVVITKGGQERLVSMRLRALGFEVYLPMRLVVGPKKGSYPVPVFPRHLFARVTLDADRWQQIFTTVGITRVLCSPDRPIGVRDDFMNKIRGREVDGYLNLIARPKFLAEKALPKGDRRRQIHTHADAVDLLLSETIDDRRSALLLSMTGDSSMRITVDLRSRQGSARAN